MEADAQKPTRVMTVRGSGEIVGRVIEGGVVTRILVRHEWLEEFNSQFPNIYSYPPQSIQLLETNNLRSEP